MKNKFIKVLNASDRMFVNIELRSSEGILYQTALGEIELTELKIINPPLFDFLNNPPKDVELIRGGGESLLRVVRLHQFDGVILPDSNALSWCLGRIWPISHFAEPFFMHD